MKKVVRLSESELTNLIKTVVKESKRNKRNGVNEQLEYVYNEPAMSDAGAIVTIVGTVIGLLGVAGWDYLKDLYRNLRKTEGKQMEAMELKSMIDEYDSNKMNSGNDNMDTDERIMGSKPDADMEDEEPRDPMAESIRRHIRRR
jgi:hypothetical protein